MGDHGALYVNRRDAGDLLLVSDKDGDGTADEIRPVARRPACTESHSMAARAISRLYTTCKWPTF